MKTNRAMSGFSLSLERNCDWAHAAGPRWLVALLAGLLLLLAARPASAMPGEYWVQARQYADWSGRRNPAVTAFHGKLWVMGGYNTFNSADQFINEVWSSVDGVHWESIYGVAPWHARMGAHAVVFNDRLWVIGGYYYDADHQPVHLRDVWSSADGSNWEQATGQAPWTGDYGGNNVAVFNGRIWVIGGRDADQGKIWSSADGATWTLEAQDVTCAQRSFAGITVQDGKLLLAGGAIYNKLSQSDNYDVTNMDDVWSSVDGVHWALVSDKNPWGTRWGCWLLTLDQRLYLIGGSAELNTQNDFWNSTDGGQTWNRIDATADWMSREGFSYGVAAFDQKIWIMGGVRRGNYLNDVWCSGQPAGPPVIAPIDYQSCEEGTPFTSPRNYLLQGTEPVTWSLAQGPAGATIDAVSGALSWPQPLLQPLTNYTYYPITVRATNNDGTATGTWVLTVNPHPAPLVQVKAYLTTTTCPIGWGTIKGATSYTLERAESPDFATPQETVDISDVTSATQFIQHTFTLNPDATTWFRVRANRPAPLTNVWSAPTSTTVDLIHPTGTVIINDGAAVTSNTTVRLTLTAQDGGQHPSGVTQMRLRGVNGAWSQWEPFSATKEIHLATGEVHVEFQDLAGNLSTEDIADTINTLSRQVYVDDANTTGPWLGTPERPFRRIQQGVDATYEGGEVIVAPGRYYEFVNVNSTIKLRSTQPEDPQVVARTIIDGRHVSKAPMVYYISSSASSRIAGELAGFTLTGGTKGAILGNDATVTIRNCQIFDNNYITQNIVTGSTIDRGRDGMPHTTVYYRTDHFGGDIWGCGGKIVNNLIGLSAAPSSVPGAVAAGTAPELIRYWPQDIPTLICTGQTYNISRIYQCSGLIANNTIVCKEYVTGLNGCKGTIRNNLIWSDGPIYPVATGNCYGPKNDVPAYCLIKGWTGGGTGNLDADPQLPNLASGGCHLTLGSPCIDAGGLVDLATDFEGDPRGIKGVNEARGDGSGFDIGVDEYVTSPTQPLRVALRSAPQTLHPGAPIDVFWSSDVKVTGTAVRLELVNERGEPYDLGKDWSASGQNTAHRPLPVSLPPGRYHICVRCDWNTQLSALSPSFVIQAARNGVRTKDWTHYE